MDKVISGFPGIGKSYAVKNFTHLKLLDSDSSKFSWIPDPNNLSDKVRNPQWPQNYITHIKSVMDDYDHILVSTHIEVRNALREANIDFTLVYPNSSIETREEYVDRFIERGSDAAFVELIRSNWDAWLSALKECKGSSVILGQNNYLSHILPVDDIVPYNKVCNFLKEQEEGLEDKDKALCPDGLEAAVVGVTELWNVGYVFVLSIQKCIEVLIKKGMTEEDAWDHFLYNVKGSYVGEKTPLFMEEM